MRLRRVIPFVVILVFIGILFVAVFPTRTWLAQREATAAATEHLDVLGEQNALLEERVRSLQSDEEIERLAREQYNLVKPGEEAFAMLPPAGTTTGTTVPPEVEPEAKARSLPSKVWHFLTGWM